MAAGPCGQVSMAADAASTARSATSMLATPAMCRERRAVPERGAVMAGAPAPWQDAKIGS